MDQSTHVASSRRVLVQLNSSQLLHTWFPRLDVFHVCYTASCTPPSRSYNMHFFPHPTLRRLRIDFAHKNPAECIFIHAFPRLTHLELVHVDASCSFPVLLQRFALPSGLPSRHVVHIDHRCIFKGASEFLVHCPQEPGWQRERINRCWESLLQACHTCLSTPVPSASPSMEPHEWEEWQRSVFFQERTRLAQRYEPLFVELRFIYNQYAQYANPFRHASLQERRRVSQAYAQIQEWNRSFQFRISETNLQALFTKRKGWHDRLHRLQTKDLSFWNVRTEVYLRLFSGRPSVFSNQPIEVWVEQTIRPHLSQLQRFWLGRSYWLSQMESTHQKLCQIMEEGILSRMDMSGFSNLQKTFQSLCRVE